MPRVRTSIHTGLVSPELAAAAFSYALANIDWIQLRTRTSKRWAATFPMAVLVAHEPIQLIVVAVCAALDIPYTQLPSIWLNLYRDGNDSTPSHKHDSRQVIISLGATRRLQVASKSYALASGDVAVFGSSVHSVPIQPEVSNERISIALFIPNTDT